MRSHGVWLNAYPSACGGVFYLTAVLLSKFYRNDLLFSGVWIKPRKDRDLLCVQFELDEIITTTEFSVESGCGDWSDP